jgi:RNA polymerase sigma-70 factor (ECF subfamily)
MVTQTLIERCAQSDPRAQYELYRLLHPMMMSICTRYERNRQDATAVMNQGFLKILRHIGRIPDGVPFDPWARRIVINTVIDAFRKERTRREMETLDPPSENGFHTEVNDFLRDMEAEAFTDLLRHLPPVSRHVFNLFAIDGWSHAEIAESMGISEGTSKWHVNNARNLLKRALSREHARNLHIPLP